MLFAGPCGKVLSSFVQVCGRAENNFTKLYLSREGLRVSDLRRERSLAMSEVHGLNSAPQATQNAAPIPGPEDLKRLQVA